jgi:glycosyltransferase involved in cell wall biosynthesis
MTGVTMSTGDRPAVTVALPVYNGARFVTDAVMSVLGQRDWDVHLVAVDDGSKDDSLAVLRGLAARDSRITVLTQPRNLGIAAARNRAIAHRDDPLVAFIDQDDLWASGRLDVAWRALADDPSLDFVLAHQRFVTLGESLPSWFRPRWLEAPQPAYVFGAMLGWRTRTWASLGGLDESLRQGDDTEWFIRAKDRGLTSRVLPDVLLHRRIHGANTSADTERAMQELFGVLRRRHSGRGLPDNDDKESRL